MEREFLYKTTARFETHVFAVGTFPTHPILERIDPYKRLAGWCLAQFMRRAVGKIPSRV
jgi:hypothetical protein